MARALNKLGVAMKNMSIASRDIYELLIVRPDGEKTVTFIFANDAVEMHALLPNGDNEIERLNSEHEDMVFDIFHDHLRVRQKLPCDLNAIVEAYQSLVSLTNGL